MQENVCKIPIIGHMTKGPDGRYRLDEATSTWAEIPATVIARFLVERCGVDTIFGKEVGT